MANVLRDASNYHSVLRSSATECFARYVLLLGEFVRRCSEARDRERGPFPHASLIQGVTTLTHVFKILLLFTRNLGLTAHHTQRAGYYYAEFIGQMGEDGRGFLQLNARDAALFVYKKTVFEINDQCRKDFGSILGAEPVVDRVNELVSIYQPAISGVLARASGGSDSNGDKALQQLRRLSKHLMNLGLASDDEFSARLCLVRTVQRAIATDDSPRCDHLATFARRLRRVAVSDRCLKARLSDPASARVLADSTPIRYVNWLVQVPQQ